MPVQKSLETYWRHHVHSFEMLSHARLYKVVWCVCSNKSLSNLFQNIVTVERDLTLVLSRYMLLWLHLLEAISYTVRQYQLAPNSRTHRQARGVISTWETRYANLLNLPYTYNRLNVCKKNAKYFLYILIKRVIQNPLGGCRHVCRQ